MEFQRQTYSHVDGGLVLVPCPMDLPLSHYGAATGLISTAPAAGSSKIATIAQLIDLWGPNVLDVPVPSFLSMLRAQMLSPLVMFQVFCSALWMLDEYWSFTLWTLGMLLLFEGCVLITGCHCCFVALPKCPHA